MPSATVHGQALALAERTVVVRHDLHAHPEIAFHETRTVGVVATRLRELGLAPRTGVGVPGVVAVRDTGVPGPTVLARADIDALPLPDAMDVPNRSQREDWIHACGHDGHTAVLLSVAELLLARAADLRGRVVFVFQPAEEIVRGAEAILADDALAGLTIDPVVVAVHLVLARQALVPRETDPVDQSVVSITSGHGGTAFNVIPEAVGLKGTLRTFRDDTRARLTRRIHAVADGIAATLRATVAPIWTDGSPAVVNDREATERLRAVAARVVGPDPVVRQEPITGGDDMARWLAQAPGCYFFVATRGDEASGCPHRHPRFDLDETALPIAVEVLAEAIQDLLAK